MMMDSGGRIVEKSLNHNHEPDSEKSPMREKVKNGFKRRATNRTSFSSLKFVHGVQSGMHKIFRGTQTRMRKIFRGTQNVRFCSSGTPNYFLRSVQQSHNRLQ